MFQLILDLLSGSFSGGSISIPNTHLFRSAEGHLSKIEKKLRLMAPSPDTDSYSFDKKRHFDRQIEEENDFILA